MLRANGEALDRIAKSQGGGAWRETGLFITTRLYSTRWNASFFKRDVYRLPTAHLCYDIIWLPTWVLGAAAAAAAAPPGRAGVICCWRKSRSWRGSPSVRRAT